MPKRIQRKRTKGWRMPEGAVYVGRPTKWGNPYEVIQCEVGSTIAYTVTGPGILVPKTFEQKRTAIAYAVMLFGLKLRAERPDLSELHGKDLACWCPLDQLCHADVLLELANA